MRARIASIGGGQCNCFCDKFAEGGLERGGVWRLVPGTEPADEAAGFFGAALGVEGDDAFEDLFGRKIVRPAVGFVPIGSMASR